MRIDNRRVNGRITIEQEDTIRTWMITVDGVDGQSACWFAGFDETKRPVLLPAGVAGAHIKTTITAFDPVQFTIILFETSGNFKILPMPVYTVNHGITKLSIDIGELIAGAILDIDLPSGLITVKESK